MITLEQLRQMPIGVLETRWIEIDGDQAKYYIVKLAENVYSIGYSTDGSYCSRVFKGESTILTILNDRQHSDSEAVEIYVTDPHLSLD